MTDRIIVGSDGRKYITNEPAQPEKPIAFFEFQDRGFYWASNTAIGPVPVARKVEPMPLYSNPEKAQPELTGEMFEAWYGKGEGLGVHSKTALRAAFDVGYAAQPEHAPLVEALYLELIYAVASKFPDETRHQTALRYIKRAEELSTSTAVDAAIKQGGAA